MVPFDRFTAVLDACTMFPMLVRDVSPAWGKSAYRGQFAANVAWPSGPTQVIAGHVPPPGRQIPPQKGMTRWPASPHHRRMRGKKDKALAIWVATTALVAFGDVSAASAAASEAPVVEIPDGKLRGAQLGATVAFKGIPYAAPPVGNLRWRQPQPVLPWSGVRDATQPGNVCTQSQAGLNNFIAPLAAAYGAKFVGEPVKSSEDCLYLNVWMPTDAAARAPLPVMVWLHGGSNIAGSGSQSTYDGPGLVSHGVILVTLNYRLGLLGSFSHPELTAESPHHSSGNYGLLDQRAALEWVRKNISRFGGDPDNVTLFGESAGAIDAGLLMTSPLSRGLFKRVISESGPAFAGGRTLAQAEFVGAAVGKAAPGTASSLQNLRALPVEQLLPLAERVIKAQFADVAGALTIDGWVLTRTPQQAFAQGAVAKVDLVVGLNGRELSAFRVGSEAQAAAAKAVAAGNSNGPAAPAVGSGAATSAVAAGGGSGRSAGESGQILGKLTGAMGPLYGGWTYPAIAWYLGKILFHREAGIDQAGNDVVVACPLGAMATLVAATGQKAYVYRFERTVPGEGAATLGAFHSLEVPYVFHALADPMWRWLPFTATDSKLSDELETYWTQFAKTGNPNAAGLQAWPAWNSDDEPFLQIDQGAVLSAQQGFAPIFCHLSPDRLRERLK
jgi:para-nitrobenzyl esterase